METETLTLDEQMEFLRIETLKKIKEILDSTFSNSIKVLKIAKLAAHNANEIRSLV